MIYVKIAPIDWGGKIGNCYHRDATKDYKGLCAKWEKAEDYIEAAHLAQEMANLPLKEQYQKEL